MLAVFVVFGEEESKAEPLRLRGDVFASSGSPAGRFVFQGEDARRPWIQAEGLAWLGAGDLTGDVLTLSARLRDPGGLGDLRVGRLVASTGAVRPIHLDGASAVLRAPSKTKLELFGGVPVVPKFGERAYDWAVGGRLGQGITKNASVGIAYVQQRDRGRLSNEEMGLDGALAVGRLDVAARGAYDLTSGGISDALVSAGMRVGDQRFELFATERTAARLLPATSLFSIFGSTPSTRGGATAALKLAPRLNVLVSAAAMRVSSHAGHDLLARATLKTSDDGPGFVGIELRHQSSFDVGWAGVRAFASVPIVDALHASTELELVHLETGRYAGSLRPWGLVALSYRGDRITFSAAAEAASTNVNQAELNVLARVSYAWEKP